MQCMPNRYLPAWSKDQLAGCRMALTVAFSEPFKSQTVCHNKFWEVSRKVMCCFAHNRPNKMRYD